MQLKLLAAGTKLPRWMQEGFREYAGRMPRECRLELHEIPLGDRARSAGKAQAAECDRMMRALRRDDLVVAMDVNGKAMDTEQLARRLQNWMLDGRDVAILIGGPDGLGAACLARADLRWSLSPLTFPHGLARVLVAEQLYRAHSILRNHPYHRA